MQEEKTEAYSYLKRPRLAPAFLIVGILQLVTLAMNVQEYREIAAAGVLSAAEWAPYAAKCRFQCAVNALTGILFIGIFLLQLFVKNKRTAQLAEGAFLLLLALAWGAAGLAPGLTAQGGITLLWGLILLLALGGSAYSLWMWRRASRAP